VLEPAPEGEVAVDELPLAVEEPLPVEVAVPMADAEGTFTASLHFSSASDGD
jgi:hypothetical protein